MTSFRLMKTLSAVGMVFGALTVFSGWQGLFGDAATRAALGNTVGYVLWFNFLAGFVYVAATPGAVKTSADGTATLPQVPDGAMQRLSAPASARRRIRA